MSNIFFCQQQPTSLIYNLPDTVVTHDSAAVNFFVLSMQILDLAQTILWCNAIITEGFAFMRSHNMDCAQVC